MLKRIVVGLDESDASRSAARWCAGLASATGARVTAVHGLGKLPEIFIGTPAAVASGLGLSGSESHSWKAKQRSCLECWCAPLREAGIDHRGELVEDDAVAALLQVADHDHADLIVVGTHGHGGMVSRLLGGVPYRLAHHARVPVVIVPSVASPAGDDDR